MTEATPGKYSKGIHIKMLPDGRFENEIDTMRDIVPIIDELKLKWKDKLKTLNWEKDKANEELV